MTTPNPTPARDAAEIARNDLALRIAMDVLGDMGRANGLAEWFGNENTDLGQAVARLITAARADERAKLAARATEQEREMVEALADRARIIREAVEKLPGIGAPEADFVAVEWVSESGRYPYRVAMPRAALLDALLGADGQKGEG